MPTTTPKEQAIRKPITSSIASYIYSRQVFLAAAFIFVISFIPYLHTLKWAMVWDDSFLASYYSVQTPLWEPFTHGYLKRGLAGLQSDYYRPFSAILFILDNRVWNWDPFGYRTTNLVIHAVVAMLVFLAARQWFKSTKAALIAGLIFCFHPAHNEVAAWPSSRCDLLVPFFLIPAYLLFTRRRETVKAAIVSRILTPVLYALALLSKEAAVIFIPLLLLDDWAKKRKSTLRSILTDYLPLLIVTGAYLVARYFAIGMVSPTKLSPEQIPNRLMDFPANLAVYLGMITWPHVPYPFELRGCVQPEHAAFWFAGIVFSLYLIARLAKTSRRTVFLLIWVLLPLVAVSDFIPLMSRWLCPRFTYLSTVALAAMYGAAGAWLIDRMRGWKRAVAVGLVAAFVGSFAWFTIKSPPTWRSNHDMQVTLRARR